MARKRKITAATVNIVLHPHTPDTYVDFLTKAFQMRKSVRVYGDRYAILSSLNRRKAADGELFGVITTFTVIDWGSGWFDEAGLQEATDEQLSDIEIPENLHPNAAAFYFLFDAKRHKLYVQLYSEGKTLTPNVLMAFLNGLVTDQQLVNEFGLANVTVVQSRQGLEDILSIDVVKVVKMVLNKPNPDIFSDDFDEEVEDHMKEAKSKRLTIEYEAESGRSLTLPPDAKRVGEAALENGFVEVRGRDETGAVKLSTANYPHIAQTQYDSDLSTEEQAFRRLVNEEREEN